MGIDCKQLRELVVRPTLKLITLWSPAAENLILGTAGQESKMGTYLKQIGTGPALGIYQMEPATHKDLWDSFLRFRPEIRKLIIPLLSNNNINIDPQEMVFNLAYATAMARLKYKRVKEALPATDDIDGLANYWKQYYNTPEGAGTVEEFKANYQRYVA